MNPLGWARAFAAKAASWLTSAGVPFNPQAMLRQRIVDAPTRGTAEMLSTYAQTPIVRALAGRVASEIAGTKWILARTDVGNPTGTMRAQLDQHLMLKTLRRPNPLMTGRSLIRVTQLSLDIVGWSYWLLERNGLGAPVRYWPIPSHWVQDTPAPDREWYRVSWGEFQANVPASEMVAFNDPDPYNPYLRGAGLVRALADEVETDEYAAKHAKHLFFSRATPEFVVMDDGASKENLELHQRQWLNRLQGYFKAFQPYFVNRKLEFWQPTQQNLENLTLVPLRKFERDIQMMCWGMPPEQMGVIENSNRATSEASDFILHDRVLKPRREFLADELTVKLAVQYDERLVVGFKDTTPADKQFRLSVGKAAPWALSQDEWRELGGWERTADGGDDRYFVPLYGYVTDDLLDQTKRPGAPTPEDASRMEKEGEGAAGSEAEEAAEEKKPPKKEEAA